LLQVLQFAWIGLLALVLILLPLFLFRRRGLRTEGSRACILYFFCLGLGFMLIEIGFMQKFTLFLGHPTYSISVILFSLLVFSGLGSLASGAAGVSNRTVILLSILCISGIALGYQRVLDPVFHQGLALPLGARILMAVLLVGSLAFFMGMPFPTGLRVVEGRSPEFVPWAWAINGSASVVAIFASTLIAVFFGFSTVVTCAVVTYLVGMLAMVLPGLGLARERDTSSPRLPSLRSAYEAAPDTLRSRAQNPTTPTTVPDAPG